MTSAKDSLDFLLGMEIILKYKSEDVSINVIEESSMSFSNLHRISNDDVETLKSFGWNAGRNNDGGSWAEYFKLEYVDT